MMTAMHNVHFLVHFGVTHAMPRIRLLHNMDSMEQVVIHAFQLDYTKKNTVQDHFGKNWHRILLAGHVLC